MGVEAGNWLKADGGEPAGKPRNERQNTEKVRSTKQEVKGQSN